MAKKNAVVIGFGGMGGWHCHFQRSNDVVNLKGVYDIKPERNQAAEEMGIYAYPSFEAVLADPEVDFLVIAVPNDMHKPLAIAAMAAGKHVISEKPVTLSSADLQEMIDASNKYDRRFTVHQNRRWDGEFLVMREVYHSGDLGRVYSMESRVHGSRGIPGDWRGKKEHGGGMMLDWGVHLIDQIVNIVDDRKLESVWCRCDHITNDEVDDGFKMDMFYEGDLTCHVEVGTSNFINMPRFYMSGNNGSAIIPDWLQPCRIVYCHDWSVKDAKPIQTAAGLTKTMAPRDEQSITEKSIPQPTADVHDFYRNFVKAIDGEEQQIVTHEQMMFVMKIMEAAFESDRLGVPVKIN